MFKLVFWAFAHIVVFSALPLHAELATKLKNHVNKFTNDNPRVRIGISVRLAIEGKDIASIHANSSLVPASVMKLPLSFIALRQLGPHWKTKTTFYVDKTRKNAKHLYVKGNGDPTLVEERLWLAAGQIAARGITQVENIIVDDSAFIDPMKSTGSRAYNAAQSALSLNFNSIAIIVAPSKPGEKAFISLPPGSPYSINNSVKTVRGRNQNITIEVQNSQNPMGWTLGRIIARGTIGHKSIPLQTWRPVKYPALFAGAILRGLLEQRGITVTGRLKSAEVPSTAHLLYELESLPLADMVEMVNRYSNNFVANQLVYALGKTNGRMSFKKGITRLQSEVKKLTGEKGLRILDGSGLSKNTRLSAGAITKVLHMAFVDLSVSPYFLNSLSAFESLGTLKDRKIYSSFNLIGRGKVSTKIYNRETAIGKTGSLDGVTSLAGYAVTPDGIPLAYSIIINGKISKNKAIKFEDALVELMQNTDSGLQQESL